VPETSASLVEKTSDAVKAALALAPEVATAQRSDTTNRGIDVGFENAEDASYARDKVNEALAGSDWANLVSAWVWQRKTSGGSPLTSVGAERGIEVRLQPHRD
jgi:hypothetical protein